MKSNDDEPSIEEFVIDDDNVDYLLKYAREISLKLTLACHRLGDL